MKKRQKNAVVILCKARPHRGGGGLGVAYNFLHGFKDEGAFGQDVDVWFMTGEDLSPPPAPGVGVDEFLAAMETGEKHGGRLFLSQALRLRKLSGQYDKVVVLGFSPFYFWPLLVAGLNNIATVHVEQSKGGRHQELAEEQGGFGWRARFIRWCVGLNFRFPDRVVFPSRGALNLFTDKNPHLKVLAESKVKIAYNGVSACEEPDHPIVSRPLRIVSVAHHVREKGLDTMLQALHGASERGVEWSFINYGQKTALTPDLVSKASDMGISPRIDFAGLKDQAEVRNELGNADVFLHTPVVVVFDLSLLEAMMHSLPIIITPLEGNREALGEDYPLYATTPAEIAERIAWVASNRKEAGAIGKHLRDRALKNFTNEAMVGQYAGILGELIAPTER